MTKVSVSSRGMLRIPHLQTFLRADLRRAGISAGACDMIAGWGGKPSGLRAREAAQVAGVPCLLVEDGFLRSVERDGPPLSLVADDIGIYHDATRASRLESLITAPLTSAERMRARALIGAWKAARISKYNHARDYEGELPSSYVLVVDQTEGDASVRDGLADATSFARMLSAALAENPGSTVVVKCHPDVFTRKKSGYFDPKAVSLWKHKYRELSPLLYQRSSMELGLVAVLATQLWHHTFIDPTLANLPDWRSHSGLASDDRDLGFAERVTETVA